MKKTTIAAIIIATLILCLGSIASAYKIGFDKATSSADKKWEKEMIEQGSVTQVRSISHYLNSSLQEKDSYPFVLGIEDSGETYKLACMEEGKNCTAYLSSSTPIVVVDDANFIPVWIHMPGKGGKDFLFLPKGYVEKVVD